MALTRREICVLLPALMATTTALSAEKREGDAPALPSAIYDLKNLKPQGTERHKYIPVFEGNTYAGMHVELHETELAPGGVIHGMYSHVGDELFLVREDLLEVEFNGKRSQVGPGSVAYIASETRYAIRNTSNQWARYFVFLFGPANVPANWKPATHYEPKSQSK
jgi:mannose-6-phosphate isomerase-like protein (cupin superfamily)